MKGKGNEKERKRGREKLRKSGRVTAEESRRMGLGKGRDGKERGVDR